MANIPPVPTSMVMLDPSARTFYYVEGDRVHEVLKIKEGTAAVAVRTSSGLSGFFSFKLGCPPDVSYLDLHWPKGKEESSWFPRHPAYSSVLAADKNLLLISIAIPSKLDVRRDLLVYMAAGPRPLLEPLPLCTERPQKGFGKFFVSISGIGILRLPGDNDHYIVADLIVAKPRGSRDYVAELCVFFSAAKTRKKWQVRTITTLQQIAAGQFPVRWITSTVVPFGGRFLCWVDYFSGVLLLSDFSRTKGPLVQFLPFPGKQYPDEVRSGVGRCCPDRFRSMSISQGMMCFVDIDNDFHERMHLDEQPPESSGPRVITIWTLNFDKFEWKEHCHINLEDLWKSYKKWGLPQKSLPEFPVITMDNPNRVWCVVREKQFCGKAWKIVVDMKNAKLHSCSPYVNDQPYNDENVVYENMDLKDSFANKPLLPLVLPKYLNSTTGILGDSDKIATRSVKRGRHSV